MARLMFITGAGISVASGAYTHRGPTGIYTNMDVRPEDVLSLKNLLKNPEEVKKLLDDIKNNLTTLEPSEGHKYLAGLEKDHEVLIVTQNVDGLHGKAGSTNVIEVHGNATKKVIREGVEIPDVVLFGDMIKSLDDAVEFAFRGVDKVVCIGTTMLFEYLWGLIDFARYGNANVQTILVDPDEKHIFRHKFDQHLKSIEEMAGLSWS